VEECKIHKAIESASTIRQSDEVFWKKDGTSIPVEYSSTLAYENDRLVGKVITFTDITEKKRAEEAAVENSFKFQSLFNEMTSGSAIYKVINDGAVGADYIIQDFNKAALKAEGKEKQEVLGKSLYDLRPNIDRYGLIPIFQRVWQTGEPAYYPSTIYIDEKFSNWYENRVCKLPSGEIVAIFDDVTEKKRAEESIQHSAFHDYLTDTYNRRFFENEYNARNSEDCYPLAIIAGDLNGLKLINDSFGHYSGDFAIKQFAIEIQKRIPEDAILARVGGDEFSVILIRSSEEEARLLTSELQSNVRFNIKDKKGNVVDAELTATFGYSCQSFPGQGLDDLVKEAETFMYRRKFLENASKRSNVVDAIMSALFEKSEREQKHSLRVSSIATAIATAMGLHETTVAKVRVAGALHDIGKIGIDESILNKAEQLSNQEWELIKQHPIRSARILSSVDEYLEIVPIVKSHHERIDGSGYPAGLTEMQIPMEAKIIAVADSFDAMTVTRP
jgi:diguanylate cyclase (GGDEF)-like protein/putative nucleotidyltransferase with HDIG domain